MFSLILRLSALILVMSVRPVAWADYASGKAALDAGDPVRAHALWLDSAGQQDALSMLALGRLYLQGFGALQNFVEAHVWFNLAASRGNAEALGERDKLTARLSVQQLAEAKQLASARHGGGTQGRSAPPPEALAEAVRLLQELGYTVPSDEEVWGEAAVAAYRAFSGDAGLPVGDTLTPEALAAMRKLVGTGRTETVASPGYTPEDLFRLVEAQDMSGFEAALSSGVDPDGLDVRGWTVLMKSVDKGYKTMVQGLLEAEAEADPDIRAADGSTALFMASAQGYTEIVRLLLDAGADYAITGPDGRTAQSVAETRGAREVVQLIEEAKVERERIEAERKADKAERRKDTMLRSLAADMVVIPAGKYKMGSPRREKGRYDNEGPRHKVTIRYSFAVGKYEVTRGQYAVFVTLTGHEGLGCWIREDGGWKESPTHSWRDPGYKQEDDHPVVCISWSEAKAYVEWLSSETGEEYRLLTESEWEYAARAGTTTRYHYGNDISLGEANYGGNEGGTVSVGNYEANGFGLYDMHGNVWEWVEDCWHDNYRGAPKDGSAWVTGGDCEHRVLRGGSWDNNPGYLRSANRYGGTAGYRGNNLGFRIARTLTP